jgi:hypothetical protein
VVVNGSQAYLLQSQMFAFGSKADMAVLSQMSANDP